jgi:transposase
MGGAINSDLEAGTVEHISDERKTASLDSFFATLTAEQKERIEAIATDMWEPYLLSIRAHVPNAERKVVFDPFHIMQHMGRALDTVRKQEHRALMAVGDDTLARSKYLWLYSKENLPEKDRPGFEALRAADLKTGRAWRPSGTSGLRAHAPTARPTGSAGTSGPRTAASSPSSRPPGPFTGT